MKTQGPVFGYDEDFVFVPADQDVFFECDSEIDRAFADGLSAAEVYDRVKALFASGPPIFALKASRPRRHPGVGSRLPTLPLVSSRPERLGRPKAKLP